MRYLHAMVRVTDLERAIDFYCSKLGLVEYSRRSDEKGRYTNVFLRAPDDVVSDEHKAPLLELTYNWDREEYSGGRNFGHLAYAVENIYDFCARLQTVGVTINRPPRDGRMAFIRSPENISIEILHAGEPLPPQEPWTSMPSTGTW